MPAPFDRSIRNIDRVQNSIDRDIDRATFDRSRDIVRRFVFFVWHCATHRTIDAVLAPPRTTSRGPRVDVDEDDGDDGDDAVGARRRGRRCA